MEILQQLVLPAVALVVGYIVRHRNLLVLGNGKPDPKQPAPAAPVPAQPGNAPSNSTNAPPSSDHPELGSLLGLLREVLQRRLQGQQKALLLEVADEIAADLGLPPRPAPAAAPKPPATP